MYIIIKENGLEVITFETKTDLGGYLGIHPNTARNRFTENSFWVEGEWTVYHSKKHYKRLRSGNKDSMATKLGKREGSIPKNK